MMQGAPPTTVGGAPSFHVYSRTYPLIVSAALSRRRAQVMFDLSGWASATGARS